MLAPRFARLGWDERADEPTEGRQLRGRLAATLSRYGDAATIADLRTSLELFLDDVTWSDKSDFRELLSSDELFLNGRLAKFYGADLPADADFKRVKLDANERDAPLKVLLSTGEFHGELKQVTKGGRDIVVDCRATLIRDPAGEPRSLLLITTDITEQKKLEMQLLRAQRLESIGTLAGGVAHDLNNVLGPILMGAESLRCNRAGEHAAAMISLI